MIKPTITFFCELESQALADLFHDGHVIDFLKKMDANLSLGLIDLSDQRAEVVKKLNHNGIPVTAWLLLSKEHGYWTSLDSIHETVVRYADFMTWANKHKLTFSTIGLDIEPKLETISALARKPLGQLLVIAKRLFLGSQFVEEEMEARMLIQKIQTDGYAVETYQFPTVLDERAAHSKVITKTLGIPALQSDREVLMLYSSFFPSHADSILWSYAKEAQAVGVGSTGGGVQIEGIPPLKTLRWIDLKHDLLLANQAVHHIYIFSLEGCVQHNYLNRLSNLDWETEIIPPNRSARGISLLRKAGQGVLWALSHPLETLFGIILSAKLIKTLRKLFSGK